MIVQQINAARAPNNNGPKTESYTGALVSMGASDTALTLKRVFTVSTTDTKGNTYNVSTVR